MEESGRISVQHLRVSQHTRWPSLVSILHAKGADGPSKRSAQNTSLTFACGISNWVVGLSPNQGVLTILAVLATVSKLRPAILACGLRSQHSGDQGSETAGLSSYFALYLYTDSKQPSVCNRKPWLVQGLGLSVQHGLGSTIPCAFNKNSSSHA